ncbi:hypothetical protein [Palleronia sp. LCG004]|uniref:hypothetical protein n=1 Tax=Palleronia sp. LCG004 TaxID=3079304 RepID=UPI002942964E|nr:hypothetical protein [Palleronia sp. LCG004]WOI56695.1 hypothetical protein RVY76_02530 [Palleronia sp. LCG004]
MTALRKHLPLPEEPQPGFVSCLRMAALDCRAAPRSSLKACELLDPDAGAEAHAALLTRTLPQMLRHRPVFWRPGASGRSFDEEWLLALARAIAHGDHSSARFLVRSRVHAQAAPTLMLLMRGMVGSLDIY